jgi:hypothetical protein
MAKKYAEGRRAWGICARGGHKLLLRDMVTDGRYPNLRVDPAWREDQHPQEMLTKVDDPIALYRASPEVIFGPTPPVLAVVPSGIALRLTWSPAVSDITEILSYTIFRGVDGVAPTQFLVCKVLRDFLGGIIGIDHCTTAPVVPASEPNADKTPVQDSPITFIDTTVVISHTYCYYVTAQPLGNNQSMGQGPASAPSNTACATAVRPVATTPVLSGSLGVYPTIVLDWTASTVSGGVITNYQLFRQIDGGAFSSLIVLGNVLEYIDSPPVGHLYGYYVVAIPSLGDNSPNSNIVSEPLSNDPFFANVVLLLHMDGTQGSASFIDSSKYAHTMTVGGVATLDTASPHFGSADGKFPDTSSPSNNFVRVQIIQGGELDILSGSQDFTIDFWVRLPPPAAASFFAFDYGCDQATFNGPGGLPAGVVGQIGGMGLGPLQANAEVNTAIQRNLTGAQWGATGGTALTLSTDTWYHFALVRTAGTPIVFLNGVQLAFSSSQWLDYVFPPTASYVTVGRTATVNGSQAPGFVDEFRVTAGIARWTSNFTPPTAPTSP